MTKFLEDIKKYKSYIVYSAKCSLKSEVAGSHLSWLWWILDPLMFMLVYMFMALVVFGKGEKYFPLFIFIGLNTWKFFEKSVKASVRMVAKYKAIVSKVYLPKYLLVLKGMLVNGFKLLVAFSIIAIMLFFFKVPISGLILYTIPLMLVLCIVTFGISTIMMHFGVFVEDLENIVTIVMKLLFYMTGIFYNITKRVPHPYNILLEKCNPIAYIVSELRNVILYETQPDLVMLGVWFVIGILLSIIGVKLIYKYENSYVKVI